MLCVPSVLNMASSDSQIDKLQRGRPKRAELPDVNINTGAQSINTERASHLFKYSRKPGITSHVKMSMPGYYFSPVVIYLNRNSPRDRSLSAQPIM